MQGKLRNVNWKKVLHDDEVDEDTMRMYGARFARAPGDPDDDGSDASSSDSDGAAGPAAAGGGRGRGGPGPAGRGGGGPGPAGRGGGGPGPAGRGGGGPPAPPPPAAGGPPPPPGGPPPAAGGPPPAHEDAFPHDRIFPPTTRLTLKNKTIFLMGGPLHTEDMRRASRGYYIKPYFVSDYDLARPLDVDEPHTIMTLVDKYTLPGMPGFPWPSEACFIAAQGGTPRPWRLVQNITHVQLQAIFAASLGWQNNARFAFICYQSIPRAHALARNVRDYQLCINRFYVDNITGLPYPLSFKPGPVGDTHHPPPPDPAYCREGEEYMRCPAPWEEPTFYEIGRQKLAEATERGEVLDFEFAQRMQGLLGTSQEAVWSCQDPDFNPLDRTPLLNMFLGGYSDGFYTHATWVEHDDPSEVAKEALEQHKKFAMEWVKKHYKTISPVLMANAEMIMQDIWGILKGSPISQLTHKEAARVFMRHPEFSPPFSSCLHAYISHIDSSKAGKNPSYKQITNAQMLKFQHLKRFGEQIQENYMKIGEITAQINESTHTQFFHELIVDWYGIAGQLPEIHRKFPRPHQVGRPRRAPGANLHDAPWRRAR